MRDLGWRRPRPLLAGPRLRPTFGERKPGGAPAVRALRIPGDIHVSVSERTLRRVPRHPAIGKTIDDEHLRAVAAARALEAAAKVVVHHAGERAVAGVGQP